MLKKEGFAVSVDYTRCIVVLICSTLPTLNEHKEWGLHRLDKVSNQRVASEKEIEELKTIGFDMKTGLEIPFDIKLKRFRYDIEKHYKSQINAAGYTTFILSDTERMFVRSKDCNYIYEKLITETSIRYSYEQLLAFKCLSNQGMYFPLAIGDSYVYDSFGLVTPIKYFKNIDTSSKRFKKFHLIFSNDDDNTENFYECAAYTSPYVNKSCILENYAEKSIPMTKAIIERLKYFKSVSESLKKIPYIIYLIDKVSQRPKEIKLNSLVAVKDDKWLIGRVESIDKTTNQKGKKVEIIKISLKGFEKHNLISQNSIGKESISIEINRKNIFNHNDLHIISSSSAKAKSEKLYKEYDNDKEFKESFVEYLEKFLKLNEPGYIISEWS